MNDEPWLEPVARAIADCWPYRTNTQEFHEARRKEARAAVAAYRQWLMEGTTGIEEFCQQVYRQTGGVTPDLRRAYEIYRAWLSEQSPAQPCPAPECPPRS